MLEQKPATWIQTLTKWLVPIAALIALGAWIYIAPPGLMGKLDAIGYAVCHRLSSHSLFVDGIQFPLCARCTGEFNAAAIALILQGFISRKKSKLPDRGIIAVLIIFFLAFAIDGSNSYLALLKQSYGSAFMKIPNLYVTNNVTRVFTGSGMGIAMASILYPMYNQTIWRVPDDKPAIEWLQFGLLVGIVLLFDFGALSNLDPILYFIAILSTLGVLALLAMVFSIVWVMIMKQDNTFNHLRQLWLPAVAGLTLAFILIISIDLFRFNLTHTWTGFPGLTG